MLREREKKPFARSGHVELSVSHSLLHLLSDGEEEAILHLELVGSGEYDPSVNLPLEKGRGAENIQLATGLHPRYIEQRRVLKQDFMRHIPVPDDVLLPLCGQSRMT